MKHRESLFFKVYLAALLFLADCYNTDIIIIFIAISLLYFFIKFGIFKKILVMLLPLIFISFIGITIAILHGEIAQRDTLRDIYKTLCPVIFILFGFYLYEYEKVGNEYFWKAMLIASYLISLRHFMLIFLNILKYGISFEVIRGVGGNMSMTTLISFIALTYLKDKITFLSSKRLLFSKILFGLSILLYLSRTMIVILLAFLITLSFNYIRKANARKMINFSIFIILLSFLFFTLKSSSVFLELIEKFSKTFTEINANNNYWDWVSINNNWRGYEIFLVKNEMSNTGFVTKIFGFGFGSVLHLGVTIKLGTELFSSIPVLHNGYYYILFKTGYIGLSMLIIFFINGGMRNIKRLSRTGNDDSNLLFILCTYIALALSMYVISGFYNGVTLLSLCGIIGYYERKIADEYKTKNY